MDKSKWEYKKLGEVAEITMGQSPSSESYNEDGNGLPFYQGNADFGILYPKERVYCTLPTREALPNDLLMSVRAPIGALNIANKHCCIGRGLCSISPKVNFSETKYLYYFLSAHNEELNKEGTGSTFKAINKKAVNNFIVTLPPLSTQHHIVSELDQLSELISLKQRQIKEYDALAQSLFYEMFGDPLVNEKGWETSTYGEEYVISSGGTPSKTIKEYWEGGNIPWIGSNMCQNCIIYETDGKYITNEGLQHSSTRVLPKGSILIALVGATIGKVALLECETAINQNVAFILNEDIYDSYYLYYHTMGLHKLFLNVGNGKFKMANQKFVKSLPVMLPPLPLQHSFASKVKAIERQKALLKQSIAETQTLLDSRMQEYFG